MLVEDLLYYSEIEVEKPVVSKVSFNFSSLCEEAKLTLDPLLISTDNKIEMLVDLDIGVITSGKIKENIN